MRYIILIFLISVFNVYSQEEITFEEINDAIINRNENTFPLASLDVKPIFLGARSYIFNEIELEKYINSKINLSNKEQRTVFSFTIDKVGNIKDLKVLKGCDSYFLKKIIKLLINSPRWKPGKKNGKNVNTHFIFEYPLR